VEPEILAFLKRIALSISLGVLWMLINSTVGIMYGYAFVEDKVRLGNILFYIWFILSLVALVWYLRKRWSKPIEGL